MTRAKDELDLIVPQRIYPYRQVNNEQPNVYSSRSRFIPNSILDAFEQKHWAELANELDVQRFGSAKQIDVAESVRRIWE